MYPQNVRIVGYLYWTIIFIIQFDTILGIWLFTETKGFLSLEISAKLVAYRNCSTFLLKWGIGLMDSWA